MFNYGVNLSYDCATKSYIVSCRDLPFMNSVGTSVDDAIHEAAGGIICAMTILIEQNLPVPTASALEPGEYEVSLPDLVSLKAKLHNAMLANSIRKRDLASMLGKKESQIARLLEVGRPTGEATVKQALRRLV